uniref:Uncharacterized protein n=1 Tax=Triticum urartu TaxID=4572 RepID=A0A8R7V905_TRIUA
PSLWHPTLEASIAAAIAEPQVSEWLWVDTATAAAVAEPRGRAWSRCGQHERPCLSPVSMSSAAIRDLLLTDPRPWPLGSK